MAWPAERPQGFYSSGRCALPYALRLFALQLLFDRMAAQSGEHVRLLSGVDPCKDQSYFLALVRIASLMM